MLSYPTPWRQVLEIWPHVVNQTRGSQRAFSSGIVARMNPPPSIEGLENIPRDPRFVLAPNHYQRKGMWIAHPASAITEAVGAKFGDRDPMVRWLVTANFPPWKLGPWRLRSPGDLLLPRVAHALWCYPVALVGTDPAMTARSIRQLLRDLPSLDVPLGIFPEGAEGVAGRISGPLPGVGRLLTMLAKAKWPLVPVGIGESGGRLVIRFGRTVSAQRLLASGDPGALTMDAIATLTR